MTFYRPHIKYLSLADLKIKKQAKLILANQEILKAKEDKARKQYFYKPTTDNKQKWLSLRKQIIHWLNYYER
jgi:hypothetical protein